MKIIRKYDEFINESIDVDELPLILSNTLINTFKKIEHAISKAFLDYHNNNEHKYNISFVDKCVDKNDTVSIIQVNKAKLLMSDYDLRRMDDMYYNKHAVYSKYRSEIKLGRLVTKIFGNQFPATKSKNANLDELPNDIESFVNMYKASDENLLERFKIVKGSAISYWYHYDRYESSDTGTLGNSCMSEATYLELYDANPDKINLLLLVSTLDPDLICGRAIVWYLDEPEGRIFMDRIYTNNYADERLFINYAIEKGWMYKEENIYGRARIVDTKNSRTDYIPMKVYIKDIEYDEFPYVDTLYLYNEEDKYLTNIDLTNSCPYQLTSTNGYKYDNDEYEQPREMVYSTYYGEDIPRDEAKWCEYGNTWVYTRDAVYVSNSGQKYGVKTCEDIVESKYSGKWFPKERCVYSEFLKDYIFEDSVRVIKHKDKPIEDIVHKKQIENEFNSNIEKIGDEYFWIK